MKKSRFLICFGGTPKASPPSHMGVDLTRYGTHRHIRRREYISGLLNKFLFWRVKAEVLETKVVGSRFLFIFYYFFCLVKKEIKLLKTKGPFD